MGAVALCFNLPAEKARPMALACEACSVAYRPVPPWEQGQTLARLLSLPNASDAAEKGPVPGEMAVLFLPDRDALDGFLKLAPPVALKAAVTSSNLTWTAPQLYRELTREHRYYHGK